MEGFLSVSNYVDLYYFYKILWETVSTRTNPCSTTQTHDKPTPLTIAGVVFMGTGAGTQKNTQGLPESCLRDHRRLL